MQEIKIRGSASGKSIGKIVVTPKNINTSILTLLLQENIPVAYSCKGEGVCKKCVINQEITSCTITPAEFKLLKLKSIEISYL